MRRALAAVAATAALVTLTGCAAVNQQTETCTVTGKERVQNVSGKDGKVKTTYENRVYTSCGTYEIADGLVSGYDSADTYGRLQAGRTYAIKTGGFRIGFFSQFPTILDVQDVTK